MKSFLVFAIGAANSVSLTPDETIEIQYRPEEGRGPLPFNHTYNKYGPHLGTRSWIHVSNKDYVNSTYYIESSPKIYH